MQGLKLIHLAALLIVFHQLVSADFHVSKNETKTALVDNQKLAVTFLGVGSNADYPDTIGRKMKLEVGGCFFNIFGLNLKGKVYFRYTRAEHLDSEKRYSINPKGFEVQSNSIQAIGDNPMTFSLCNAFKFEETPDKKFKISIGLSRDPLRDFKLLVHADNFDEFNTDSNSFWIIVGILSAVLLLVAILLSIGVGVFCYIKRKRQCTQPTSEPTSQRTFDQPETNKSADRSIPNDKSAQKDVEARKEPEKVGKKEEKEKSKKETKSKQDKPVKDKPVETFSQEKHTGQHNVKICSECFLLKPNRVLSEVQD